MGTQRGYILKGKTIDFLTDWTWKAAGRGEWGDSKDSVQSIRDRHGLLEGKTLKETWGGRVGIR